MSMTANRLILLVVIDAVCHQNPVGCASPKDVALKMGKKTDKDRGNIKTRMYHLFQEGWTTRSFRGCYTLSDKGRKLMVQHLKLSLSDETELNKT